MEFVLLFIQRSIGENQSYPRNLSQSGGRLRANRRWISLLVPEMIRESIHSVLDLTGRIYFVRAVPWYGSLTVSFVAVVTTVIPAIASCRIVEHDTVVATETGHSGRAS